MGPIEIICNGYIEEREGIDTAETNEAADNLMGMIESLLPDYRYREQGQQGTWETADKSQGDW